jgi:hypothetical protein
MRHVKFPGPGEAGSLQPRVSAAVEALERELALATGLDDRRLRLIAAMQLLGSVRDQLVAPVSDPAGRLIDDAIQELMRRERDLPAEWRSR